MANKIELDDIFKDQLINAPETGMGYHLVSVRLKNGKVLNDRTILNCSLLVLNEGEKINQSDILDILPKASE